MDMKEATLIINNAAAPSVTKQLIKVKAFLPHFCSNLDSKDHQALEEHVP